MSQVVFGLLLGEHFFERQILSWLQGAEKQSFPK